MHFWARSDTTICVLASAKEIEVHDRRVCVLLVFMNRLQQTIYSTLPLEFRKIQSGVGMIFMFSQEIYKYILYVLWGVEGNSFHGALFILKSLNAEHETSSKCF